MKGRERGKERKRKRKTKGKRKRKGQGRAHLEVYEVGIYLCLGGGRSRARASIVVASLLARQSLLLAPLIVSLIVRIARGGSSVSDSRMRSRGMSLSEGGGC